MFNREGFVPPMDIDAASVLTGTFYHLLVMDGAYVAAALLCDINECPVCTCLRYPLFQSAFSGQKNYQTLQVTA